MLWALIHDEPEAQAWIDRVAEGRIAAVAPGLIHVEVANVLGKHVWAGRIDLEMADERLTLALDLPLEIISTRVLARQGLALAATRGVSLYDGLYLALALGYDAPLVTADRRLAAAVEVGGQGRAVLLPPV